MDLLQAAGVGGDVWREGGVFGEHEGAVDFLLGDHFDCLSIFALGLDVDDGAGGGFGALLGGTVALLALNDEAVGDEVGEDVAVQAMRGASVKGAVAYACTGVEGEERGKGEVCGDDDVELGVKVLVGGIADVCAEDVDFDAGVEFLDVGGYCFGALYV